MLARISGALTVLAPTTSAPTTCLVTRQEFLEGVPRIGFFGLECEPSVVDWSAIQDYPD
jgi:hypothetical protein